MSKKVDNRFILFDVNRCEVCETGRGDSRLDETCGDIFPYTRRVTVFPTPKTKGKHVWAIVEGGDNDGVDEGADDDQGLVTFLVYFLKGVVNVNVRRCGTFEVPGSAILDV